jgi:hypothetical protein
MAPDRGIILTWLTNMVDQIPTVSTAPCHAVFRVNP